MPGPSISHGIARAFLAGEPALKQVIARASMMLGRNWRWLRPLAKRYIESFAGRTRPQQREVVRFLVRDPGFRAAWGKYFRKLSIEQWLTEPQRMQPVAPAQGWEIPVIESAGDLADWLGVEAGQLEWFADLKALTYKSRRSPLRHYTYRVLGKGSGCVRLIEAPKPRLKVMQRQILSEILEKVPAHDAAHGFLKGRSIKTFVAPHVGQRVVLKMDLRDFFPSIAGARVQGPFPNNGIPRIGS